VPAGITYLGHTFDIKSIEGKKYFIDTSVNVLKRREELSYHTGVPKNVANIAFVGADEVDMGISLSIADRSTSLVANRPTTAAITTISGTKIFEIATERFLVTDVFSQTIATLTPTPLFYKHVLSDESLRRVGGGDESIHPDVKLVDVEILNVFQEPIGVAELSVDYDEGVIYNNLLSEYLTTGDYTVYYVKYTVNDNGVVYMYIDLLDNQPVYRLATFEDLTPLLTIKQDGRKVYLIQETIGGFEVTLPVVGTYAYKASDSANIEIIEPTGSAADDPWYIRISAGDFLTNVQGTTYRYRIAEFLSQTFTPYPPIKQVGGEISSVLSQTLVKLDNANIIESDTDLLYVSMLINDADGEGVAAFTTDPFLADTIAANGAAYKMWNTTTRYGIKSIDHKSGFVDIDGFEFEDTQEVVSTYFFEEQYYAFTDINFNPISNRDIVNRRIALFIDPELTTASKTQTLYYLAIDDSGRVIESNWSEFDNDTETLSGVELYYELKPDWKPDGPYNLFVGGMSVEEASGVFLILGDVTVDEGQDIDNLTTLDTRIRGGGLAEDTLEEALEIQPEARWYADQGRWDGVPYPRNANYLVEVPVTLLEGAGGTFRSNEIRQVVERHTAAGVYAAIRGYGINIVLQKLQMGSVVLGWQGTGIGGLDVKYNVYYSTQPNGPWTLSNTTPIDHVDGGGEHTITGLKYNSLYYVSIVGGIIENGEFLPVMSQYIRPGSYGAAGIGTAPIEPIIIRSFIPSLTQDATLGHVFTLS